jgi:hypothetical protein
MRCQNCCLACTRYVLVKLLYVIVRAAIFYSETCTGILFGEGPFEADLSPDWGGRRSRFSIILRTYHNNFVVGFYVLVIPVPYSYSTHLPDTNRVRTTSQEAVGSRPKDLAIFDLH